MPLCDFDGSSLLKASGPAGAVIAWSIPTMATLKYRSND